MSARTEPIQTTTRLFHQRYPKAQVIFVAGSAGRKQITPSSDLDLLVVFDRLPTAYRESFIFLDWPVEAFIHDLETLQYFFLEDVKSCNPATLRMAAQGIEVPRPTPVSKTIRQLARAFLDAGPPPFSDDEEQRVRYMISTIVSDISDPRSQHELIASGAALYDKVAYYYFRSRGLWGNSGKLVPRTMLEADPAFAEEFCEAFSELFGGKTERVVKLVEELFAPLGGLLFDGYHYDAPPEWRSSMAATK